MDRLSSLRSVLYRTLRMLFSGSRQLEQWPLQPTYASRRVGLSWRRLSSCVTAWRQQQRTCPAVLPRVLLCSVPLRCGPCGRCAPLSSLWYSGTGFSACCQKHGDRWRASPVRKSLLLSASWHKSWVDATSSRRSIRRSRATHVATPRQPCQSQNGRTRRSS